MDSGSDTSDQSAEVRRREPDRSGPVPWLLNSGGGLPHSDIRGSKLVRSSPRLFAAYHVLHRLRVPRHPPNALKALDRSHYPCPPRPGTRRSERRTKRHSRPDRHERSGPPAPPTWRNGLSNPPSRADGGPGKTSVT